MRLENFIKPRYDAGGFAGLPQRIRDWFASQEYEAIVLLLVDGFGWRFLERYREAPFLSDIRSQASIEKLTAQFPSTTAAHLTTIHTGLPVGQSGIYEWYYYEPLVDAVIAPLLYSYAGTADRNTLGPSGVKPKRLYPSGAFYRQLKSAGVDPHIFQHRDYTPSPFSDVLFQGASIHPFRTIAEGLVNLGGALQNARKPFYGFIYLDSIDSLLHQYGPAAPQVEAEIITFLLMMQHFHRQGFTGGKRTLFLMTADHGQSEVDPDTVTYLNLDERFGRLLPWLRTNRKGETLFAGSARDMFLYVHGEHLISAQELLTDELQGKAEVVLTGDLIEAGYFGPKPFSKKFPGRLGNLVILPYLGQSVWWYEKDRFRMKYYGHHGGLTREEMEIPLIRLEID
ncbi:MAG: alkaline phosphatase family protein [Anaerolineales bacterium]|nr:alkaline phosphatase family protein [Anaerolineales bacterium]